MKYLTAIFLVLGFGIITGASTQDWMPMLIAQLGLGTIILIAAAMVASLINDKDGSNEH